MKKLYKTIFRFIKRYIYCVIKRSQNKSFGGSVTSNSGGNIESLNNQTCQPKITLVNLNSNETLFLPIYCQC